MIFLYFEKNICKLFSSYVILRRLFTTYKLIIHQSIFLINRVSVCSPTVRIIAFQAIDPGSTPGKRNVVVLVCPKRPKKLRQCKTYDLLPSLINIGNHYNSIQKNILPNPKSFPSYNQDYLKALTSMHCLVITCFYSKVHVIFL